VVAAAWLLRQHAPELKVRVVNVVDLMTLYPRQLHPHGFHEDAFVDLFTADRPVVFGYHGYPRGVHALLHGRTHAERFHVRGYEEEGSTTTPFDMVVRNKMSRFHLCIEALRRAPVKSSGPLTEWCHQQLEKHERYIRDEGEDLPEIRDWVWSDA
jgi:xylulose-5-phosphate/fructose-6-phosphate phosphoketolase